MSLIHDALKKAQKDDQLPIGSGLNAFQEPIGEPKAGGSRRVIVMAVILVAAVGFYAYRKFSAPAAPAPVPAVAPALPGASPDQAAAAAGPEAAKRKAFDAYKTDDLESAWINIQAAALAAPQDAEVWNNYGVIARKRGDLEKAREAYTKAIELKPQYPEALNNLALMEMQADNTTKAKELLEKALNAAPAYPEANFHLGLIYDRAGEKQKAAEYYKRFLEVSGSFTNTVVEGVRDRVMEIEPQ